MTNEQKMTTQPNNAHHSVTVEHFMDFETGDHRSLLKFVRADGIPVAIEVLRSDLLNLRHIQNLIADKGGDPSALGKEELNALVQLGANVRLTVETPGWLKNNKFAWPKRGLKAGSRIIRFVDNDQTRSLYGTLFEAKGSSFFWGIKVGRLAKRSSFMMLGIGVVLAAPLVRFSELPEGGIFHLAGDSGTGKSLTLLVAQSLMGLPERDSLWSWDATPGGDDRLFHATREMALILDDTSRDRSSDLVRRMSNVAYGATGGGKKWRAKAYEDKYGSLSARRTIFGLSSGESAHAELARNAAKELKGGAKVRIIDVHVPKSVSSGVFDRLRSGESGAQIAANLERELQDHYGWPFRRYLKFLEGNFDQLKGLVGTHSEYFIRCWKKRLGRTPVSSEERVAQKFALVYVGLVLGVRAGVIPLKSDLARQAVMTCLESNLRPQIARAEMLASALRHFRVRLTSARLFPVLKLGSKIPNGSVGFRRITKEGRELAYILPDQFREAAKIDAELETDLMRELQRSGAMLPGQGDAWTRQVKIDGSKKRRYVLDPKLI